jgi:hypothetical protein
MFSKLGIDTNAPLSDDFINIYNVTDSCKSSTSWMIDPKYSTPSSKSQLDTPDNSNQSGSSMENRSLHRTPDFLMRNVGTAISKSGEVIKEFLIRSSPKVLHRSVLGASIPIDHGSWTNTATLEKQRDDFLSPNVPHNFWNTSTIAYSHEEKVTTSSNNNHHKKTNISHVQVDDDNLSHYCSDTPNDNSTALLSPEHTTERRKSVKIMTPNAMKQRNTTQPSTDMKSTDFDSYDSDDDSDDDSIIDTTNLSVIEIEDDEIDLFQVTDMLPTSDILLLDSIKSLTLSNEELLLTHSTDRLKHIRQWGLQYNSCLKIKYGYNSNNDTKNNSILYHHDSNTNNQFVLFQLYTTCITNDLQFNCIKEMFADINCSDMSSSTQLFNDYINDRVSHGVFLDELICFIYNDKNNSKNILLCNTGNYGGVLSCNGTAVEMTSRFRSTSITCHTTSDSHEITNIPLNENCEFIVLASQELWLLFASYEVVDFVRRRLLYHQDIQRCTTELISLTQQKFQCKINVAIISVNQIM